MFLHGKLCSFFDIDALSSADKETLFLWLAVAGWLVINSLYFPGGSVVFNYLVGAQRWLANENLYAGPEGYLYLPQFAMFFSVLPANLVAAEIIWNSFQLIVVVSGLFAFSRVMVESDESSFFPLLSLIVLIISCTTLRNGQATILLLGIMLWTMVSLVNKNWNRVAVLLISGLIAKPVFIVFFLLVIFFHFRLCWRLLIGLVLAFFIPVLFKGYNYTLQQHIGFVTMVQEALSYGEIGHKTNWADFFAIFPQVFGVWVPSWVQMITRVIAGFLVLCAISFSRKHYSPAVVGYYLYAFAACYLVLFNPRTETNSFALIAPAIGYWIAVFKYRIPNIRYQLLVWAMVLSFPFAKYVKLITPGMWAWGKPVITLVFCMFLIRQLTYHSRHRCVSLH